MISQIAALSINYVIWNNNTLPWHFPEDLKHFKKLTTGKTIVMGRKTFESIGKPLPNRINIVLTRNTERTTPWVQIIHSIDDLRETYQESEDELMVIWWEQIYKLFLPYTSKLYLTEVKKEIEGDAFYPEFKDWFGEKERIVWDEYDFVEYERIASIA